MIKEIFNLVLSASQLPDSTGPEKKAIVMAQIKELDIPGYDEDVASMAVDIAVRVYKCPETKNYCWKPKHVVEKNSLNKKKCLDRSTAMVVTRMGSQ